VLDQIETGYEARFDFPARAGEPTVTYLLASVPRAGSTLLSHMLWETGCLGAPLEYLNFDPAGPYAFAASSPDAQRELWHSVLHRRTSPNGVFGLKAFPLQLQKLQRHNPPLLADVLAAMLPRQAPRHVVYLRRRDRVAQTVSYARAAMSGVWRREQESAGAPAAYSHEALEAAERGIAFQESLWERMFADLRIEPLRLFHEDVLADGTAVMQQVATYIGVTLDPSAAVNVPKIEKQTEGDSREWIERYKSGRLPG
jgi:LPS sulfotransferase NodH